MCTFSHTHVGYIPVSGPDLEVERTLDDKTSRETLVDNNNNHIFLFFFKTNNRFRAPSHSLHLMCEVALCIAKNRGTTTYIYNNDMA